MTSPIGGEGWSYAYDDLNHLTTATNLTNGADSQSYTYDAGDRILTSSRYGSYTYPAVGSVRPHGPTSVGGTALTYDANGNTLGAGGGVWSLTWNADNRLSQTTLSGVTATFSYGGDGDRVKKTSSLGTSVYPFGDDYEITGGVTTKYVTVDGLGVVAKRVGTGTGAVTYWLHADQLGSIQAVTNTAGAIVFRRQYRPYGETLAQSGSHTESRGWIDQRNDGESGLTYLHARYFAPQLGVFVSPDPIGVEGGMNLFAYALGDPVNAADHSGLARDPCEEVPDPNCRKGDPAMMGMSATQFGAAVAAFGGGIADFSPWLVEAGNAWQAQFVAEGKGGAYTYTGADGSQRVTMTPVEAVDSMDGNFYSMDTGAGIHVDWEPIRGPTLAAVYRGGPAQPQKPGPDASVWEIALYALRLVAWSNSVMPSVAIMQVPDAATRVPTLIYSSRVLVRSATEPGPFHNFPMTFDSTIVGQGAQTIGNGGYVEYGLNGSINTYTGTFEIGGRFSQSGTVFVVTHRFFDVRP